MQRLLAFAIFGLSAFAYWQPYPQAWPWVIGASMAVAIYVIVSAVAERKQVLEQPFSIKVSLFFLSKFIWPVVVIVLGAAALLLSPGLQDAAVIAALVLAIALL